MVSLADLLSELTGDQCRIKQQLELLIRRKHRDIGQFRQFRISPRAPPGRCRGHASSGCAGLLDCVGDACRTGLWNGRHDLQLGPRAAELSSVRNAVFGLDTVSVARCRGRRRSFLLGREQLAISLVDLDPTTIRVSPRSNYNAGGLTRSA